MIFNLVLTPYVPPSWTNGTNEELTEALQKAHAGEIDLSKYWSVGDVRTITISAFTGGGNVSHSSQDIDIVISSFDEYEGCGNVLQFDFKDALAYTNRMNGSASNVYNTSEMKSTTLPNLANALPSWLKNALIEFPVKVCRGNGFSNIDTITGNKLALRSEIEIMGTNTYSRAGEGSQVGYYSSVANRNKKLGHTGANGFYWLRSPRSSGSTQYCSISAGTPPSSNYGNATGNYGLAPFGCL